MDLHHPQLHHFQASAPHHHHPSHCVIQRRHQLSSALLLGVAALWCGTDRLPGLLLATIFVALLNIPVRAPRPPCPRGTSSRLNPSGCLIRYIIYHDKAAAGEESNARYRLHLALSVTIYRPRAFSRKIFNDHRSSISGVTLMKPLMEVDTQQIQLGEVGGLELGELRGHSSQDSADIAMPDTDMALSTPQQILHEEFVASLGSFTPLYPNTRSRANQQPGENTTTRRPSQALRRLQTATKNFRTFDHRASLESSRDLQILGGINQAHEEGEIEESAKAARRRAPSLRPELSRRRVIRRSERIKSRHQQQEIPHAIRKRVSRKPQVKLRTPPARHLRRSARLAKPLTEFHKYSSLPAEIRMIIWEQAINPRVVYIRNRQVPLWLPKVHTPQPTWFAADHTSEYVAGQRYQKMFGLQDPTDDRPPQEFQNVNPDVDIIVLEPCCNGCRGFWCTRQQFSEEDRNAVRFLAVQIDSPHLALLTRPCWETLSMSFPNIETLYLMRKALKGEQPKEKALIRVEENEYETALRARFNEWKKGAGNIKPIDTLEFVVVVDREPDSTNMKFRYRNVEGRKTHLPEDIIMG